MKNLGPNIEIYYNSTVSEFILSNIGLSSATRAVITIDWNESNTTSPTLLRASNSRPIVLFLSLAFILITSVVLAGKPVQSQHTTPQRDYGPLDKCPPTTHHLKLRNTDWSNPIVLDKLKRIRGSMQNIEK